ncbi:MAG: 1,6-anhydro-N-acetylmuramyl-L-alanine amidase AmpD [Colwellia sp.]
MINKDIQLTIEQGWLKNIEHKPSPFFSPRDIDEKINLLVIHNISLPPGEFGGQYISDLFLGQLEATAHKSFADIAQLKVSAHCLIRRNGSIIQYVSFNDKAWHAGVSVFDNRDQCNDFSIGIELEGTDSIAYTQAQYQQLTKLTTSLQTHYPFIISDNIVGHCDIAPVRKTDPGEAFDWHYFRQSLHK